MNNSIIRGAVGAALLSITTGVAAPAWAACNGHSTQDACVMGLWQEQGNGAAEWMQRNAPPGMESFSSQNSRVLYSVEGYFSDSPGAATAVGTALDGSSFQADLALDPHAIGKWSTSEGRLHLCSNFEAAGGLIELTLPDGQRQTIPMPVPPVPTVTSMDYSCGGDRLETRMSFPGIADPMIQTFQRQPE